MRNRGWRWVFVLLLHAGGSVAARADSSGMGDELELLEEEQVSAAARRPQKIGEAPYPITLITRAEIEDAPSFDLHDLLRGVPGLDVILPHTIAPIVGARAGTTEANDLMLTLIDLREVNLEYIGYVPYALFPISLEDIERVEIIRAPASALWGANAFQGIIHITTRRPTAEPSFEFRAHGGEVGTVGGVARGSFGKGRWRFLFNAGYDRREPFLATVRSAELGGLGGETIRGRALAEYESGPTTVTIEAGASRGIGLIYLTIGESIFRGAFPYLRASVKHGDWMAQVSWNVGMAELDTQLDLRQPGSPPGSPALGVLPGLAGVASTVDAFSMYHVRLHPTNLLTFGGNVRSTFFQSDQLLPPWSSEARAGVFFQDEIRAGNRAVLTLGARFDGSNTASEAFSPQAHLVLSPATDQYLRGSFVTAFRKPSLLESRFHLRIETGLQTVRELFTGQISNPDLDNQKIYGGLFGYTGYFAKRRLKVALDLFYYALRDLIEFQAFLDPVDLSRSRLRYENAGFNANQDAMGGELAIEARPARDLSFYLNWGYRQIRDIAVGHLTAREPFHRVNGGWRWRAPFGMIFSGSVHYVSRFTYGVRNPTSVLLGFVPVELGNYAVLLVRLGYRSKPRPLRWEAGVLAHNFIGPPHLEFAGLADPRTGLWHGGEPVGRRLLGYLTLVH